MEASCIWSVLRVYLVRVLTTWWRLEVLVTARFIKTAAGEKILKYYHSDSRPARRSTAGTGIFLCSPCLLCHWRWILNWINCVLLFYWLTSLKTKIHIMADARSQDSRKLTNENEDKFIILGIIIILGEFWASGGGWHKDSLGGCLLLLLLLLEPLPGVHQLRTQDDISLFLVLLVELQINKDKDRKKNAFLSFSAVK